MCVESVLIGDIMGFFLKWILGGLGGVYHDLEWICTMVLMDPNGDDWLRMIKVCRVLFWQEIG